MTKPWDPKRNGWAGQWDRHRWPKPGQRRGSARRLPRFSGSELRLMLLAGLFAGLAATQLGPLGTMPPEGGDTIRSAAIRVIDGDTIDYDGMRVRIADIDTPEVNGRCAYETDLAARATRRLRALLASGDIALHPPPNGRDEDRYGRKLRIVTRDGRSVGDMLVAEGLARTWTGRREPWCAVPAIAGQ